MINAMVYSAVSALSVKRLQTHAQFEEVLQQTTRISHGSFVLHYRLNHLSTCVNSDDELPVDKLKTFRQRLGLLIPKRWAKRAVTRSLIKRQCRVQFAHAAALLPAGDWVVRLRRKCDTPPLVSAASLVLKRQVQLELHQLFQQAQNRLACQPETPLADSRVPVANTTIPGA